MTKMLPRVEMSIGIAICNPRSSSLEDETATPRDAKNAKR
jgi:hypothetical protein